MSKVTQAEIQAVKSLPRPFDKMFKEGSVVRPLHLLYQDLQKERTDISKMAFANFLERKYSDKKGFYQNQKGYRLEFIDKEN